MVVIVGIKFMVIIVLWELKIIRWREGCSIHFNDTYPTAAMELGDETALLITTRGSDLRLMVI